MWIDETKLEIDLWLITSTTLARGKMVVSYTDWKNHMLFRCLKIRDITLIIIQRVSAQTLAVVGNFEWMFWIVS